MTAAVPMGTVNYWLKFISMKTIKPSTLFLWGWKSDTLSNI